MSDDTPTVEKPTTEKLATGAQPAPAGKPSALPEAEITRLTDEIVTALKTVYVVAQLPKTRSGKILRKLLRLIANGQPWDIPSTIEDPDVPMAISAQIL